MATVKYEWYTNKTWDGKIDAKFEDNLKRSRGNINKAEFIQIQGCLLLESTKLNIQDVGVELLFRLFSDFPAEHVSIILAQEKLGDHYLKQNNFERAEHYFRIVVKYCKIQNSTGGTSGLADLKLAETIVKSQQVEKLEEAYQYVIQYPFANFKFNNNKFYYAELAAHVCDLLDKKEEAKAFAKTAIQLSAEVRHPLNRYRSSKENKDLVKQLRTLTEIKNV